MTDKIEYAVDLSGVQHVNYKYSTRELFDRYKKLLEFVKHISEISLITWDINVSAKKLLKEIGEF